MAFVQTANNSATGASSVTIGSGQSWGTPVSGHLLVADVRHTVSTGSPNPANFSITGWTAVDSGAQQSTSLGARTFYKISDGTETSVTANFGATTNGVLVLAEFSGVASSGTFDTSTAWATGTSVKTLNCGTATPSNSDVFLLAFIITNLSPTPYDSPIFPNFTDSSYAAGSNFKTGERYAQGTGGSTTYNATAGWSAGTARNCLGQLVAFKRLIGAVTGSSAATSAVTAAVVRQRPIPGGSSAATSAVTASVVRQRPVAGSSAASSAVSAALVAQRAVAGSVAATSAITATVTDIAAPPAALAAAGDDWAPQFVMAQQIFQAHSQALLDAKRRRQGPDVTLQPDDWLDDDLLAAMALMLAEP